MITSITVLTVADGSKQQFIDKSNELVILSNREEGCVTFNLYEDLEQNNVVAFIEVWKDQVAIHLHGKWNSSAALCRRSSDCVSASRSCAPNTRASLQPIPIGKTTLIQKRRVLL